MWTRRRVIQAALAAGAGVLGASFSAYATKSSLQAVREALTALRAQRVAPPPLEGYRELRGVVHVHTNLSHDSTGTVEEILDAARAAKLDFLVTTDHYSPRIFREGIQGLRDSVLVLRGAEVAIGCAPGGGPTLSCATVLAIGLQGPVDTEDWNRLFADIKAQGAFSIIAHPRGMFHAHYFTPADGMEIYDIADTMRQRLVDIPRYIGPFLLAHDDYREELFLPIVERSSWNLAQWDRFTRTRRYVGLGGSDAHQNLSLGDLRVDSYGLMFRALHQHVLATAGTAERLRTVAPPPTAEQLLAGLRAGRCFTAFNLLADAAGFRFLAREGETGPVRGLLGEEVAMQEGLVLHVLSPIPGAILLLRDGVPVRRQEGRELRYHLDRPGVYRVEVSLKVVDRWRPWIFANPIYVRA